MAMLSVENTGSTASSPLSPAIEGLADTVRGGEEAHKLRNLFVAALGSNSEKAHKQLLTYLSSLSHSCLETLRARPDLQHYIHRLVQHDAKYPRENLDLTSSLASFFPQEVAQYRNEELPVSYSYSDVSGGNDTQPGIPVASKSPQKRARQSRKRSATVNSYTKPGDLFTFTPDQIPATYREAPLRVSDLVPAAGSVCEEMRTTDQYPLLVVPALPPTPYRPRSPRRSYSAEGFYRGTTGQDKPLLCPVLSSELEHSGGVADQTSPELSPSKGASSIQRVRFGATLEKSLPGSSSLKLKDAYDVIEAFATGKLRSEAESVYLNYSDSSPWNPYSLVLSTKTRAHPQHFVISKFGILRVFPDGRSDLQSFADWLREASLFTMLRKIPFFRLYLTHKTFRQWYRNVRYNQFVKIHSKVSKSHLKTVPQFREGLSKIQSLSEELLMVTFHLVHPLGAYTQDALERSLRASHGKAQRLVQRYFKYCRRVISEVIQTTQNHCFELETEKRHQPFISDLPISVQKEKHAKLDRDLGIARHRVSRLGEFAMLVDLMVESCLRHLAHQNSQSWVKITLEHTQPSYSTSPATSSTATSRSVVATPLPGEGGGGGKRAETAPVTGSFLLIQLKFCPSGGLTTHPHTNDLKSVLLEPLHSITGILIHTSHPLTSTPHTHISTSGEGGGVLSPPGTSSFPSTKPSTSVSTKRGITETQTLAEVNPPPSEGPKVTSLSLPPSLSPGRKPKSLLRALKGVADSISRQQGGEELESERARSRLSVVQEQARSGDLENRGIDLKPSPLAREKLTKTLHHDEFLQGQLGAMETAVEEVCLEIEAFLSRYGWLVEVWQFVREEQGSAASVLAMTAQEFETTLDQLYQWAKRLALIPAFLTTSLSLVSVGTGDLLESLLPRVTSLADQLKRTGVGRAQSLCRNILAEARKHTEGLSSKRYDLEGFAEYSRQLRESQEFHRKETENINYIIKVHSILLKHGAEVPAADKLLSQELRRVLAEFEIKLREAEEFVSAQTPLKAQGLQESFQLCEKDLRVLVNQVNEGKFIDPHSDPSTLIEVLDKIQESALAVRSQLMMLSKWTEAVTGLPYNLSNVTGLMDLLLMRQELWKYRRTFDSYEREWMKAPFKKLNIEVISEKVTAWLSVCHKLERTLSSTDPVLEQWRERLEEFQRGIPLLKQLSSRALKTSHWFTVFAALGEDYNPLCQYTLTDFALYNIYKHSGVIFEICHDAMQEQKLRERVTLLQEKWETKTVSILQIPSDQFSFVVASSVPANTTGGAAVRKPRDKATTFAVGFAQTSDESLPDYLYYLSNEGELSLSLEDSAVQLKALLMSPHLRNLKGRAETLLTTLTQLEELLSLLARCQHRWLDLLKLFLPLSPELRHTCGLDTLQQASLRFQEITWSIRDDSRVLSLLGKRRGQKGVRELQGDALRHSLENIMSMTEAVLKLVHSQLDKACSCFPRLHFLSEGDILRVISHSGSPISILPLINRVLPFIGNLRFTEVISSKSPTHVSDEGDEEGFQILSLEGSCGEPLPLVTPLSLGKKQAPDWLAALERATRYSLACALGDCHASLPEVFMGTSTEQQADSVLQWLSTHPHQAVLLALEIKWASQLYDAISREGAPEQLNYLSSCLHTGIDISVKALRHLCSGSSGSWRDHQIKTLSKALQNIVLLLNHKMELVRSLLESKIFSSDDFNLRLHILYSCDGLLGAPDREESRRTTTRSSTASTVSLAGSKAGSVYIPTMKSSLSSLAQRSPAVPLQNSSLQSLTASSKSLLNSRSSLLSSRGSLIDATGAVTSSQVASSGSNFTPMKCMVHCVKSVLPYGFEHHGCHSQLVLTRSTESCLLSAVCALGEHSFLALYGERGVGKSETARETAKVLGRHCFSSSCCPQTVFHSLRQLLLASLKSGSILLLENAFSLSPQVMLELGQYFQSLSCQLKEAFKEKQAETPRLRSNLSSHSKSTTVTIGYGISPSPTPPHTSLSYHSQPTPHPTSHIDWYRVSDDNTPSSRAWPLHSPTTATIEFSGRPLIASSMFGCVLTVEGNLETTAEIPDELRTALRCSCLPIPNLFLIAESLFLSCAFTEYHSLSRKLVLFMKNLHQQLQISSHLALVGVLQLKNVVHLAAKLLGDRPELLCDDSDSAPPNVLEGLAIVKAVSELYSTQIPTKELVKLQDLLESYFPGYSGQLELFTTRDGRLQRRDLTGKGSCEQGLFEAIRTELRERHLQCLPDQIEKVHQLHQALQHHRCIVLTGLSGTGKTTCHQMLSAAYQRIRELQALGKQLPSTRGGGEGGGGGGGGLSYPQVNTTVISPSAYSWAELFGSCDDHQQWKSGIIVRLLERLRTNDDLKTVTSHPDTLPALRIASTEEGIEFVQHWLVLDGPMSPLVAESLVALASPDGLCLPNGRRVDLPGSCRLLVETSSLSTISPSLLSHCALVHCGKELLSSDALVETWLDRAPTQHNLSAMSTETLGAMISQLLPDTLDYLQETNVKHRGAYYTAQLQSRVYGILETRCFLNLLSSVLERNCPKVESSVYGGTGSHSSRLSSRMSDSRMSRASSALPTSHSISSIHNAYSLPRIDSYQASQIDMHVESEAVDYANDDAISECSDLEAELGLTAQIQMATMLVFAYIWSIGALVPFSDHEKFNEFARELFMQLPYAIPLPEEGSVFDYYLNLKLYQFVPWAEKAGSSSKASSSTGYVALPELERYAYITDIYLSYGHNVLLVGERGSGKTAFVQHLIQSRMPITHLPITHTLTTHRLQSAILNQLAQLEKRAGQRLGAGGRKTTTQRQTFFLDDLHLALRPKSHASREHESPSALLEMINFASTQNALLDTSRNYQHDLHNVRYVASCTPGSLLDLFPLIGSSFTPVPFLTLSDESLCQIFSKNVQLWVEQFPVSAIGDQEMLSMAIAVASVAVFKSVSGKFQPSPARPHYLFTMHDLLHVYEGLLLMSPDTEAGAQPQFSLLNRRGFLSTTAGSRSSKKGKGAGKTKSGKRVTLPSLKERDSRIRSNLKSKMRNLSQSEQPSEVDQAKITMTLRMLVRLWCHENTRVYTDRLTDSKDRMWFLKLLEACMKYCFSGMDLQGHTGAQPIGSTAVHGRRARGGGRVRSNVPLRSEGPSLEDLIASGIKIKTLQELMPKDPETKALRKLIPYDQLTVRGEDVTGLMFAQLPRVRDTEQEPAKGNDNTSESGDSEERSEEGSSESDITSEGIVSYTELGDGQVMEILIKHLQQYIAQDSSNELVMFKGAIEHCTRICRVLNLPGSHALLLGPRGTGRKSLTKLMAFIMDVQLFELSASQSGSSHSNLNSLLREVCISAGLEQRSTVLLVTKEDVSKPQEWKFISELMNEGICSGLFSSSELLVMTNKLLQSRMKKTAEGAQKAFARSVQRHLHVFIVWDCSTDGSLFEEQLDERSCFAWLKRGATSRQDGDVSQEESMREVFLSLCCTCSHVDHYQPWPKQAYSDIALRYWQTSQHHHWQEWVDTASQLESMGTLAGHIHLTSSEMLNRSMSQQAAKLVSPKTFTKCLQITQRIAKRIKGNEKAEADHTQSALHKLESVDRTVHELEQQLATLRPQLTTAEGEVQQRMSLITAAKKRYMAANQRCKFAEETIETETENAEELRKVVKQKFEEVAPVYHSALDALTSVQKNDILEVMSYRDPPSALTPVFDALCMLFDRPQNWEDCKQLLLSQNFFVSLRFFDRDNVPASKLHRLEKTVTKNAKFDSIEHGSKAVVPLCMWLVALVDYHHARSAVKPFEKRLNEAERTLKEANDTYVAMRKDMIETKKDLETTIRAHKESVQKAKNIETKIKEVKSQLDNANCLLSAMSSQRQRWEEKLKAIWNRIDSIPGHALLCAASLCYLSRLLVDWHEELFTNWLGYCLGSIALGSLASPAQQKLQSSQPHYGLSGQQQVVKIEKSFTVQGILSTKEERATWELESVFPNSITMERCLAAQCCCVEGDSFPLIVDPHSQFCKYLKAIESANREKEASPNLSKEADGNPNNDHRPSRLPKSEQLAITTVELSDPSSVSVLQDILTENKTVVLIIKSLPKEDHPFLTKLLQKQFARSTATGERHIEVDGTTYTIHPSLKLYITTEQPLTQSLIECSSFLSGLSRMFVIDLSLSGMGLQSYFRKFIINLERPEFGIRHKSLQADLALHQQQIEQSQKKVLDCTVEFEGSLLHSPSLISTVKQQEQAESTASEQIRETQKILRLFEQQSRVYVPLVNFAATLFTAVKKLGSRLGYLHLSLGQFQKMVAEVIAKHKGLHVPDNSMALTARVLHLKHQLMLTVFGTLCVHLFCRHQTLLPLMISLESLLAEGQLTSEECRLLGRDFSSVEEQLDVLLTDRVGGGGGTTVEKPDWVSVESWCGVLQLQKCSPPFRRLAYGIASHSTEWKEYFGLRPSLQAPVPVLGESVSLFQKTLLWKVFKPEEFPTVSKELTLLTVGSDFTLVRPSTVPLLLPHTTPQVPTLCLLPPARGNPDDSSTSADKEALSPMQLLESAAVEMGVKVHSCSVVSAQCWGDLRSQLSAISAQPCWIVLKHCHLCNCLDDRLEEIVQMLAALSADSIHPSFRVWVPLPVHCSSPHQLSNCKSYQCIVLENPKSGEKKKEILQDFQLVMDPSPSLTQQWESYKPLVSKLQHFVPSPLSHEELQDLNPFDSHEEGQSQLLLAHLYEELSLHNSLLTDIHASLHRAVWFLNGQCSFSAETQCILNAAASGILPETWSHFFHSTCAGLWLSSPVKLLPVLRVLRDRVGFYTESLQSGSLPASFSPLWFSSVGDFLSRLAHSFARECQLNGDESTIECKLVPASADIKSETDSYSSCVVLHGLALQRGSWDLEKGCLDLTGGGHHHAGAERPSDPKTEYSVIMSPTYSYANSLAARTYQCPVFVGGYSDGQGTSTRLAPSPFLHVSLPLSSSVTLPQSFDTYLSCSLPM